MVEILLGGYIARRTIYYGPPVWAPNAESFWTQSKATKGPYFSFLWQ